ncbi:MAG: rRNA maturation RNase YbeY [Kiritimatiellales bacterium]
MKITVRNQQKKHRLNLPAIRKLTAELAVHLRAGTPAVEWEEVTLLLADNAGITQTNREFFGKDRPTDVISFRYDPIPGEAGCTGDLIVNVDRAVEEGPQHSGVSAELALYIAHGFNHLSGADDNTPARRAAMRRTELRRLAGIKTDIKTLFPDA